MRLLNTPPRDLGHGKLAGLNLPLGQFHQGIVMAFRRGLLFVMRYDGKRGAEHEPGGQQPNPDHFNYPVTGTKARDFAKPFLNALRAAALLNATAAANGPKGPVKRQARGGLNSGRPETEAWNCSRG